MGEPKHLPCPHQIGDLVFCKSHLLPMAYAADWRDVEAHVVAIRYAPEMMGGYDITISEKWPPVCNGDLVDGWEVSHLENLTRPTPEHSTSLVEDEAIEAAIKVGQPDGDFHRYPVADTERTYWNAVAEALRASSGTVLMDRPEDGRCPSDPGSTPSGEAPAGLVGSAGTIPSADIPDDIREIVLKVGIAEWGQTEAFDADGHANHVAESVKLTTAYFDQSGPQHMHGLYIEGSGTVICHTGTSPNSPQIARALTGAWNWLHEQASAIEARSGETRSGSTEGESAVPNGQTPTPASKDTTHE